MSMSQNSTLSRPGTASTGINFGIGDMKIQWNLEDLEIKTRSVERILEPLVIQVTTLVNTKNPANKKRKGKSKRSTVLVQVLQRSIEYFIEVGLQLVDENPQVKNELMVSVDDVQQAGETMVTYSKDFIVDPSASHKRENMIHAARILLKAVTRLLILADMVDVHLLLKCLGLVQNDLENLRKASSQAELLDCIKEFGKNANNLMAATAKRQQELIDPGLRDELAAARAFLKKHSTMLLTASKVYLRHPELAAAKANRDFILQQVCEAVNTINDVVDPSKLTNGGFASRRGVKSPSGGLVRPGEIASILDEFDERIIMEPLMYREGKTLGIQQASLDEKLNAIINGAMATANSSWTRDDHRGRIMAECNNLKNALQNLLTECMSNMDKPDSNQNLDMALAAMCEKTGHLRTELRQAVAGQICDSYFDTTKPLILLIQTAKNGDVEGVQNYAPVFLEHGRKLVEIANLACGISNNEEGVRMVQFAAAQIQELCPQIVNAAKILAAHPKSKVALENMKVFYDAWEHQVGLLTEAVDDITTIDDFLSVTEAHILEDVNKCIEAVQDKNVDLLYATAGAIRGRGTRVTDVVTSEMSLYEPGLSYVENVLFTVRKFQEQQLPQFGQRVEIALNAMKDSPSRAFEETELIDSAKLVYEGVREIRQAVLMNRADGTDTFEGNDQDDVFSSVPVKGGGASIDEYPGISAFSTAAEAMRHLKREDQERIAAEVAIFRTDKLKFDLEMKKWDENGNDIVTIAKQMCMIMMDMTEFTRGKGSLRTTMDVIDAAKRISELGTKLDKIARQIADQCPESSTKKDLLAYLQRISLYCHQLKICSKVKADAQNLGSELIVSGLDSATSLITTSKNLMNAVVLTVRSSYVATTKYRHKTDISSSNPIVVWKMKAPQMKPLVRQESHGHSSIIRRESQKRTQNPVLALSEFESLEKV